MKKSKAPKIILIILIIIALAAGAYYYYINYYNKEKEVKDTSTITVNYYIKDTTEKIDETATILVQEGDYYETKALSPITTNDGTTYAIRETTGNTTGVADTDKIEVNYYYVKKG